MNKKGILIKLDENEAVIMTRKYNYYKIKSKPYMMLGQEYEFKNRDIILPKKNNMRQAAFLTSVAATLLFIVVFYGIFLNNPIVAYLDININPSIELGINAKNQVIEVHAENSDANRVLEGIDIKGRDLSDTVSDIIKKSIDCGYIKEDVKNYILVAAFVKKDSGKMKVLDRAREECNDAIKQTLIRNIDMRFVNVDKKVREQAEMNKISMGRYMLYVENKNKGSNITIEEARSKPLTEMIDEAGKKYEKEQPSPVVKNTPVPTAKVKVSATGKSIDFTQKPSNGIVPTPAGKIEATGRTYTVPVTYGEPKTEIPSYNTPIKNSTTYHYDTPKPVEVYTPVPSPEESYNNRYDLNRDGVVDSRDSDMIWKAISVGVYIQEYDLNGDGRLDKQDPYTISYTIPSFIIEKTPVPQNSSCDLNNDGVVNNYDLEMVQNAIKYGYYDKLCDINADGAVNDLDYQLVLKNFSCPPVETPKTINSKYDLNKDGYVDINDLTMVRKAIDSKAYYSEYDFNHDKVVDDSDYYILKDNMK